MAPAGVVAVMARETVQSTNSVRNSTQPNNRSDDQIWRGKVHLVGGRPPSDPTASEEGAALNATGDSSRSLVALSPRKRSGTTCDTACCRRQRRRTIQGRRLGILSPLAGSSQILASADLDDHVSCVGGLLGRR